MDWKSVAGMTVTVDGRERPMTPTERRWASLLLFPMLARRIASGMRERYPGEDAAAIAGRMRAEAGPDPAPEISKLIDKVVARLPPPDGATDHAAGSHLFSFLFNYVLRREYRSAALGELMGKPYGRVVVLHVVIIFGGFAVMALDSPMWALLLLVGLEIGLDTRAHLREHRSFAARARRRASLASTAPDAGPPPHGSRGDTGTGVR